MLKINGVEKLFESPLFRDCETIEMWEDRYRFLIPYPSTSFIMDVYRKKDTSKMGYVSNLFAVNISGGGMANRFPFTIDEKHFNSMDSFTYWVDIMIKSWVGGRLAGSQIPIEKTNPQTKLLTTYKR